MRILVCGMGSIGQRHIRNLMKLGVEEFVLYRTGKGMLPVDEFQHLPSEMDLAVALDRWTPTAVVVSNPTSMHMDVALAAAEAGCHILLEKPVAHSLERIPQLQHRVAKKSLQVLVGYQFRFHQAFRKIKELLDQSVIGEISSVQVEWGEYLPDWHPWEDYRRSYSARKELGGGVILTLSHPLDYLHWMFGPVISVGAATSRSGDLDLDVEDIADLELQFSSGLTGHVHLDYIQRPGVHRFAMTGEKGSISWDNIGGRVILRVAGDEEVFPPAGEVIAPRNKMFLDEAAHFIEVVKGKIEPVCTLEDGIHALEIAMAALRSSDEGRHILLAELQPIDQRG